MQYFGENGIIKKAQQAKGWYENGVLTEEEEMNQLLAEYANMMTTDTRKLYINVCDASSGEHVAGAVFRIYLDSEGKNLVKEIEIEKEETYVLDGSLPEGTYYVTMIQAPAGYNLLTSSILLEITGELEQTLNIEVNQGTALPSTGSAYGMSHSGGYTQDYVDTSRETTISFTAYDSNINEDFNTEYLEGVVVNLYRVADISESFERTLAGGFVDADVSLNGAYDDWANKLYTYATDNNILPDYTATTGVERNGGIYWFKCRCVLGNS